jgi:glycosyltransferase involved in cell wall biosynthesis
MMRALPYVSVIIPTYNRAKMLPITLDSFLNQDYPRDRYEIIVANNNSTDDTQKVLDAYGSREAQFRSIMESRQGVHYARNSAARIARGDILYFTDDDMMADRQLLSELVKVFDLDTKIGSATGKIIGRFDAPPPEWVRRHLLNQYLSLTEPERPDEVIISPDDLVYSCHQAIRRDALFQCGGFNPENTAGVWIGDGETGLGIKLKRAGFKFAYTPKSIIHHMIPESRTTLSYLIKRIGNQGTCDSYTDYRRHRTRKRVLKDLLYRNSLGFVRTIQEFLWNIRAKKESWHFLPARIAYIYKRNLFDLKLLFKARFRDVAEIDDWISDPPSGSHIH